MVPEPGMVAVTAAIALGNAVATLVVYRRLRRAADGRGSAGGRPGPVGAVVCPVCGAENDPGYRFCRECVAELPGRTRGGRSPASPLGGGTR